MSALDRQTQIVHDVIDRSRLGMQIENIQQVGDQTPDSHIFALSCSCGEFIYIGLDQGKNGEWLITAKQQILSHAQAKHHGSLTAGV